MILVAGAASLSAQDLSNGTVAGRVTGANGQPLSGVSVTLNSPSLLTPRQFTTDANGQFRAQMLLAGNYTITYSLNGYMTRRLTTYVAAGQTIRGDMQLRPIEVQGETVEIMASSAQHVDKTDTLAVVAMNQEKITELMGWLSLGGSGLISIVPGVLATGDDKYPDYMMRGATQRGGKLLIDGGNATNMMEGTNWGFTPPLTDALESMSFVLSPLNARYGNTDGGLVSFVLAKGSNNFKGTLRVKPIRGSNVWGTINPTYPDNRGQGVANPTPSTDQMTRDYEFYLSGPLWKDHITFSWSSRNTPSTRTTRYQWQQTEGIWVTGNGSTINPSRYRMGTYFTNPNGNGEVIRKAEMLDASDPMTLIPVSYVQSNNTYTLYYQINQNHQIEYSYTEVRGLGSNNRTDNTANLYMADTSFNPIITHASEGDQRRWNVAYKGIIGSSGLLEARMSAFQQAWTNVMADGRPKYHARMRAIPSINPINPSGNLLDPNNYYASGLLDAMLNRQDSIKDSRDGGYSDYGFNASNEGPGDIGRNEPINVNYQHILETKSFGRHIFDVGFDREKSSWTNPNINAQGGVNAERVYWSPGRIANNLTANDIFNYAGTPLSNYQGKFIVYNVNYATFNSVDPYAFTRFNKGVATNEPTDPNMRLRAWDNGQGWGRNFWPMMYEQYGDVLCELSVQQMSYYLNDLWTINDHHSVMAGVRFDTYKASESKTGRDIHSYSQPTFRFEYKFDVNGDQKRVANLSWAQYHTMAPISSWVGFANRGVREKVWVGQGHTDGKPYLVDFDEFMNMNNYETISDSVFGEVNEVDKDYKGLVRTEITTGMRFNLDNGGHIRVTYIQSSIGNDGAYLYNDWKPNPNGNGTMVYSRKLANIKMERSYKSVELEWEVPVTKRLLFGGSYMFARKMENNPNSEVFPNSGESNVPQKNLNKTVYYWDAYDQFEYPGWGWNPIMMKNSEHQYNAYIAYDLSAGKVKSNVAFRVWYTSSGFDNRIGYDYELGYPIVPGISSSRGGDGIPNPFPGGTTLRSYSWVYTDIHSLSNGADGWGLRMNYNLELPIAKKLRWFASVLVENPFNHRQKNGDWWNVGWWSGGGRWTPETIYKNDGSVFKAANTPYVGGVWKDNWASNNNYGSFAPKSIVGGRSMSLQTGLRF
jgi:hypothetical protein